MKKLTLLFSSTIVLFIGVVILSIFITQRLSDYREKKEEIAKELGAEERLTTSWEWIPGNTVGAEKVILWQKLEREASVQYRNALWLSVFLAVFMLLYVGLNAAVYRAKEQRYRVYGFMMVFCSISFLFLALQSPFLEVMAFNRDLTFKVPLNSLSEEIDFINSLGIVDLGYTYEQTFDGRIYYLYQNKSVVELIKLLYTGGNYLVAILVLFVSIIFPLFKFIMSLIILGAPQKKSSLKLYKIIYNLAKWSMIDVFTAGLFLAYFAYSNMTVGVDTGAETLVGLYYFIIFVALSINSGQYLKKTMKQAHEIPTGVLEVGFRVAEGSL